MILAAVMELKLSTPVRFIRRCTGCLTQAKRLENNPLSTIIEKSTVAENHSVSCARLILPHKNQGADIQGHKGGPVTHKTKFHHTPMISRLARGALTYPLPL